MKRELFFLFLTFVLCFNSCDDSKPNMPPIVVVSANPVSGLVPLTVNFTASAEDGDGIITSYNWDFGDGTGSSMLLKDTTYIYTSPGTFTVTCIVKDNGKPALSASATVVITAYQSKIPTLSSISPDWSVIHMPRFTLTVTGTDFFPESKIVFNDMSMPTTYINPTQLSCQISPDDTVLSSFLKSDGSYNLQADQNASVLVRNPGLGGGDSDYLNFTVKPDYTFSDSFMVSKWSEISHIKIFIEKYIYVHFTFEEYYMRCSVDKGITWDDERRMPDYYHPIYGAYDNNLATDSSGAFYWIYDDENKIYMKKTTNRGASWSDPILIYAGTPYTGDCMIGAQNANVVSFGENSMYAVWLELLSGEGACNAFDVWMTSSPDRGNTWGTPVKLTPGGKSYYPVLSRNKDGVLHLFYYLSGPPEQPDGPRHAWSTDGGKTWKGGIDIYPDVYYSHVIPYVGHSNGLYLSEIKTVGSEQQIGVKISLDGGNAWSDFKKIKSLPLTYKIYDVSFVEDTAGNINVFYSFGTDDSTAAVLHQRSIDEGKTWSQPKKVTPNAYKTMQDGVDCDYDGNLYVLYYYVKYYHNVYFTSSERNRD